MEVQDIIGGVTIVAALVLIFLGWSIAYRNRTELIAGYDNQSVADPEALAKWIGKSLLVSGVVAFLTSLMIFILPTQVDILLFTYVAAVIIGAVVATLGSKRYKIR